MLGKVLVEIHKAEHYSGFSHSVTKKSKRAFIWLCYAS